MFKRSGTGSDNTKGRWAQTGGQARRYGLAVLASCLCIFTMAFAENCPSRVRVAYIDIDAAPFINGNGVEIPENPGLAVRWAKTALAKTGCTTTLVQWVRLPALRVDFELSQGTQDITVIAAYTDKRAATLKYPMKNDVASPAMAIGRGDISLFALEDTEISWDDKRLLSKEVTVGVVRGQVGVTIARQNGWQADEAPNASTNFRKLLLGRVQVVLEQTILIDKIIAEIPEVRFKQLKPPVRSEIYFSPVSNRFYSEYPEFVEKYWMAMCRESRAVFSRLAPCVR